MDLKSGELNFRPGRAGEGEMLNEIAMRSVRSFCGTHYGSYFIQTWLAGFDNSAYDAGIAAGRLIIAESAEGPIGFVEWGSECIRRLYVTRAGQGLGRRLLELGEQGASAAGAASIELEAALNAVSFYEHCGYVKLAPGVFSGRPEGMLAIPMMLMRKTI